MRGPTCTVWANLTPRSLAAAPQLLSDAGIYGGAVLRVHVAERAAGEAGLAAGRRAIRMRPGIFH